MCERRYGVSCFASQWIQKASSTHFVSMCNDCWYVYLWPTYGRVDRWVGCQQGWLTEAQISRHTRAPTPSHPAGVWLTDGCLEGVFVFRAPSAAAATSNYLAHWDAHLCGRAVNKNTHVGWETHQILVFCCWHTHTHMHTYIRVPIHYLVHA